MHRNLLTGVLFLALLCVGPVADAQAAAPTKPALGRTCKAAQVGTVSGTLVCTKSGRTAVWRKAPVTTTTVLDAAKAPAGTLLSSETFDDPAKSTWPKQSGATNQNRFDPALIHPRTRVALRCIREGQSVQVTLSLDGRVVMDTTTPALTGVGDGFALYMSTFTSGFRDAAELLIDNVAITKV